jgi:osmoprotectant transport system substrate-binding protein
MPRMTRITLLAMAALIASVLAGCASSDPLDTPSDAGDAAARSDAPIVVGSQAYYSNEAIAEIYAQALEGAGFEVTRQFNVGQRDAYWPEIESGAIDVFPEYTGNLLEFLDPDTDATSADGVYAALQDALPDGVTALDYAAATDQDTYTVLKDFAEENGITSIADLAGVDDRVTLGGGPQLEQLPYGPAGAKSTYGVDLGFSATGPSTLDALLGGQIQVADIYTADPAFHTEDIVALEDPANLILPSNVVPVVSSDVVDEVADVINAISAKLSVEGLIAVNVQSTVDELASEKIAEQWLQENALD